MHSSSGAAVVSPGSPPIVSQYTKEKAHRTRLALESYYSQLLAQHSERQLRSKKLEDQMNDEGMGLQIYSSSEIGILARRPDFISDLILTRRIVNFRLCSSALGCCSLL